MPLWRIFSSPSTFNSSQRAEMSRAITELYTLHGLPAFYVNAIFIDTPSGSVWIGGEEKGNFVRIVIEQIALKMEDSSEEGKVRRQRWMDMIGEKVLKPFVLSRPELEVEHHIYETPRDFWRIQNIVPPPSFSEEEKLWVKENKPIPYQKQPANI